MSQSLAQTPPSFPACSRWCCCLPACLRAWVVLQVAHDIHRDEPNFSIVEMVATNIAMVGGGGRWNEAQTGRVSNEAQPDKEVSYVHVMPDPLLLVVVVLWCRLP